MSLQVSIDEEKAKSELLELIFNNVKNDIETTFRKDMINGNLYFELMKNNKYIGFTMDMYKLTSSVLNPIYFILCEYKYAIEQLGKILNE